MSLLPTDPPSLPQKVLVIGMDAATLDLLGPWVEQGLLPNFAAFFARGAVGRMRSVPNQCSAAAWPSMVTGLNPGKHGLYWFTMDKPGTYEQVYINAAYRDGPTVWRILSDAGKAVGAINVPISYPAEPVNGYVIAGIDAPGIDAPRFTYPDGLASELLRDVGGYTIEPGIPTLFKAGTIDEAARKLHETITQRYAWTRHLMQTRPWDFLMVVFRSTDPAQHFFWKYMDPTGFAVGPADVAHYGNVIRDVYCQIDGILGELVALAGPETTVFLVSDHGGAPADGRNGIVPLWLEHHGWMHRRIPRGAKGALRRALGELLGLAYRQLDKRTSRDFKLRLATRLPWLRRRAEAGMWYHRVDWPTTRAYSDGKRPDIWINLRGRQPQGIVAPGAEYEALRDEIIAALLAPHDPQTGEPFVSHVYRREEVYHGRHVDRSPDLVVEWNRNSHINNLVLGGQRVVDIRRRVERWNPTLALISGAHDRDGLVAIAGPGIIPGARIEGASLLDVAPTVLYLSGQPIPAEMDGCILSVAIDPQLLAARPPVIADAEEDDGGTVSGYSEQEAQEIGERLRGLGYVE